jgi:hypothetical protein
MDRNGLGALLGKVTRDQSAQVLRPTGDQDHFPGDAVLLGHGQSPLRVMVLPIYRLCIQDKWLRSDYTAYRHKLRFDPCNMLYIQIVIIIKIAELSYTQYN